MTIGIGSLCTGYGGLDLAVEQVTGGRTVWVSDIEDGPKRILARRFPDAPNIGDFTRAYWARIQPVDILTAGYPCQPFSQAGQRKGADDERHLWPHIATAIGVLRPRLVVLENVAGHLSLGFGDVLGDLARLGYDAQWVVVSAAGVGACHRRKRVFITAHPAGDPWRLSDRDDGTTADPAGQYRHEWGQSAAQQAASGRALRELAGCGGAPLALLPTPTATFMDPPDMDGWEARRIATKARVGNGNGFGTPLGVAVRLLPTPTTEPTTGDGHARNLGTEVRILPTPRATDGDKGGPSQRGSKGDLTMPSVVHLNPDRWGEYAGAIARHEHMLERPAPEPTEPTGRGGAHRLSPRFVEWMMAIPDGWVTDVPDLLRHQQLRALGNGVVPIQAATALRHLLSVPADWEAAA